MGYTGMIRSEYPKVITRTRPIEDDWKYHRNIIENILKSKLGKCTRIHAHKCQIIDVSPSDARLFYGIHHLKGFWPAKYHIGLEYDGQIVLVMSFSQHHEYDYELIRMASMAGVTVVGGMSKILGCFRKQHPGKIVSYIDRDISNGKSYYAVGFKLESIIEPSYWYVETKNLMRVNQESLQKHKLTQFANYTPDKTEEEIIRGSNMYFRIHNSGNLKMVLD